jgi:RNA 2',3'-cyclic 3'-phosphodiesterase
MPRLFIAAEIPEWAKEKLAEISFGLPDAHWVPEEQYHLTLRFLGEMENSRLEMLRESLASLKASSFYLTLHGLGLFPLRGDPEVLWTGVDRSDELLSLRHKVERLVVGHGVEPDTRKFFPHITLARIGNCDQDEIGQYLVENSLFKLQELPIQSFGLYSSHLTSEGAIHQLVETFPLDGLLEVE